MGVSSEFRIELLLLGTSSRSAKSLEAIDWLGGRRGALHVARNREQVSTASRTALSMWAVGLP
jgi:hypothetical protein